MNIEISPKEYERCMNWYDANMYCQLLVIDGKNDWRLPTLDELKEIYNSENDFENSWCWSSFDEGIENGYAWAVYIIKVTTYYASKNNYYKVRAVRDI